MGALALIAAAIALANLTMSFARTPPEDASANLARWWRSAITLAKRPLVRGISLAVFGLAIFALGYSVHPDAQSPVQTVSEKTPAPVRHVPDEAPKSQFIGLDDAKRWQIANSLFRATVGNSKRRVTSCHARVWGATPETPGFKSASAFWNEIMQIMYLGDWSLEGGQRRRDYFPDGITVKTAGNSGETFDCAFHLTEWFKSIGVKTVTLEANQTTPDLVECKNECIELVIGNVVMRQAGQQ